MLMGHHLKPQIEIFFNCILKVIESKTFPIREIFLEILLDFSKEPQFITDLYVNFDCDPACSNIFEDLCKFLYKVYYYYYFSNKKNIFNFNFLNSNLFQTMDPFIH